MPVQTTPEAVPADVPDGADILRVIGPYVDGFTDGDAT
jgi:hypothetical protein